MGTSTRRSVLTAGAAVAATTFFIPRYAKAAEHTYKYGNNVPADHPINIAAQRAADRIKAESGGRMEINIFPSNQLGGDTDMLSQVRSGALEFYTLSALVLGGLIPAASISGVGFAFPSYDAVWAALDGALGSHVRATVTKAGLVPMEKIWDNGFRQITTSTKPITSADDMKGLKIRVPVSPMWQSLFKAFGSAPVGINFAELYPALQTKLVEAQENPLTLIKIAKLYEVQKYCSLTNHMWDGFWFVANKGKWDALPSDLREIVARNLDLAAQEQRRMIAELNQSAQAELEKSGVVFNTPDSASFRTALTKAKFYTEWKQKFGPEAWAILEKFSGELS
ncbi:MAG: TRAP transporter substrate-binding protein [Hyphomicrobiaceae bacterium]|nr:TRAP transporter substrate-binding protein [Hyphomicrobiaceae bacterium]